MPGGKKKKKPAANPARGFATVSIVSKKELDVPVEDRTTAEPQPLPSLSQESPKHTALTQPAEELSPEEFEKQLDRNDLQSLVDKYAPKSKRDATRVISRLTTDRRVLRGQAESLNTRKWLPPELMEEILDLVKTEAKFNLQSTDTAITFKQSSEEELTIRLWTLQQSLVGAGFLEHRVSQALQHVLDISDKVGAGNKDAIWGMDECLDWLAKECSREELPDYDNPYRRAGLKSQNGW